MRKLIVGDMYDHLKINSTIYAVHERSANKKQHGGKVVVCKVKSFYNDKGTIWPLLKAVGSTAEVHPGSHKLYLELSKAIDAIRS